MPRTIRLAGATITVLIAAAIVGFIAYDKDRSSPYARTVSYDLGPDARTSTDTGKISIDLNGRPDAHYRVQTTAKAAVDLGQNRSGCTLTGTSPPEATCDIATAFPDIGLNGIVIIVGSARSNANDKLIFRVDD